MHLHSHVNGYYDIVRVCWSYESQLHLHLDFVLSHHHCHARWTHKCTNTHTLKTHNLLKPLLLQTDDIKVEVCPQAIGPVESDSPGQAIPVGLYRERQRDREDCIREDIQPSASSLHLHFSNVFLKSVFEAKQSKSENTHTLSISPSFIHCFCLYSLPWHQDAYTDRLHL